ncbi:MAG: hypothetical protein VYC34_09630, partial [Planctomycetota bacterium]|nr:hypothetical protein [Planctomycetota bacterium]
TVTVNAMPTLVLDADHDSARVLTPNITGIVDVVVSAAGQSSPPAQFEILTLCSGSDLNGDGAINAADLSTLLGHWGACP